MPPIADVLPHSGPMILLDEVVAFDGAGVRCRVTIRPGSMFVDHGRVPAIVALEYMAQAAAAHAGLEGQSRGEGPRVGYILGTRELSLEVDDFEVGDELVVEARRLEGDERLVRFRCIVTRQGERVASADLNVLRGHGKEHPE